MYDHYDFAVARLRREICPHSKAEIHLVLTIAMFERYTEEARRVIFFARYEASNYGSQYIESEHLLLGFVRERREILKKWFPGQRNIEAHIRDEINRRVSRSERISTSVEIPLTMECRKILQLAAEAADRLGQRQVQPEHVVIAILQVESCLAAQILTARGLKASGVEKQIEQEARLGSTRLSLQRRGEATIESGPSETLKEFLEGLKSLVAGELVRFFAKDGQFIDASGKRWRRQEIENDGEMFFAGYAKKNAFYVADGTLVETKEMFVAVVLWKNALPVSEERAWIHRMTFLLRLEGDDWKIVMVQVTPVQASSSTSE